MYYLYGYEYIVKQLNALLLPDAKNILNLEDEMLRKRYYYFLSRESIFLEPIDWQGSVVVNYSALKKYTPEYCNKKIEHFIKNSTTLNDRIGNGFFKNALQILKNQQLSIYLISQFIIKIIVTNHLGSYTNGTTENTIGLSIMDFKDDFSEQDFIELVVHQLTHMLYFIADRVNPQMKSEDKAVLIPTKFKFILGGNSFPAYLAFHSYLVAVEVLLFRYHTNTLDHNLKYHGTTDRILNIVREFQKKLTEHLYLFTSTGKKILDDASDSIDFLVRM